MTLKLTSTQCNLGSYETAYIGVYEGQNLSILVIHFKSEFKENYLASTSLNPHLIIIHCSNCMTGTGIQIQQKHVTKIARYIGLKYRKLGRELGFHDAEIDTIHHDNKDYGTDEVSHKILMKWIGRRGSKATKNVLIKALQRSDLADVANKL